MSDYRIVNQQFDVEGTTLRWSPEDRVAYYVDSGQIAIDLSTTTPDERIELAHLIIAADQHAEGIEV